MQAARLGKGEDAWERAMSAMLRAHLKLADMDYVQLAAALRRFGHDEDNKNLSARVNRGRFSAKFMTQCLVAMGFDTLHLPIPPDEGSEDRGGADAVPKRSPAATTTPS